AIDLSHVDLVEASALVHDEPRFLCSFPSTARDLDEVVASAREPVQRSPGSMRYGRGLRFCCTASSKKVAPPRRNRACDAINAVVQHDPQAVRASMHLGLGKPRLERILAREHPVLSDSNVCKVTIGGLKHPESLPRG